MEAPALGTPAMLPRLQVEEITMSSQTPTTEQLRRDIDAGQTGEKIDFPDPAAAPLGTDDEASGNPPSAEQRRMAARTAPDHPQSRTSAGALIYPVLVLLVVIGIAVVLFLALG
jgi:hypothetical protein